LRTSGRAPLCVPSTNPFAKCLQDGYETAMAAAKKTRKKNSPLITIASEELVRKFPKSKDVSYAAGANIFKEGSKAESCCLVIQGRVQIFKKTQRSGKVLLAEVKAGEFLGEMAMLSGERRSASAVALTRVKAIVIQYDEFETLLKQQHPFAGRLSLHLSSLLATRCHRLLRLIARQPEIVPLGGKKTIPIDVRAVLNRVYTLWAV
jgi:CRP/FNR family cyclic AMP-dependent transcriptional regulator